MVRWSSEFSYSGGSNSLVSFPRVSGKFCPTLLDSILFYFDLCGFHNVLWIQ
uniref:Uncharacterized protein n=1 Tax=Rhizophora mucronata TaxID=61149 RepID=A0A2P2KA53_RHIMU